MCAGYQNHNSEATTTDTELATCGQNLTRRVTRDNRVTERDNCTGCPPRPFLGLQHGKLVHATTGKYSSYRLQHSVRVI